jgi:quinol monooxygenase YgiN
VIIVIAEAHFTAEAADGVVALLASTAAASRGDAGCIDYRFTRDVEDPTLFFSVEKWESKADLDAHMAAPHTQALLGSLEGKVAAAPVITVHEVSSSNPYS